MDDGLIQAPNEKVLLQRVEEVLQRCREHNIKLSFDKLAWGTDIKFAGYRVSADGVKPDEDKVSGIAQFPTPKNITDLRAFLGLANQLGSFLPNLSQSCVKMRELLKKGIAFLWTDDHEEEFQKVKHLLTSPLMVKPFNPAMTTALLTDASRLNGMGYALVQFWPEDRKKMNLIQCGSTSFTPTQQNYATIELEALAIKWGIEKCSYYLKAMPSFIVVTDHKPLKGIFAKDLQDMTNQRLVNFREKLVDYNFEVEWDAGKNHLIADALSRAPVNDAEVNMLEEVFADIDEALCLKVSEDPALQLLYDAAEKDETYQCLIAALRTNNPSEVPSDFQGVWADISLMDDALLVVDGNKIVVPQSARKEILRLLHLPHTGVVKTIENARQLYFWPTMRNDIKQHIASCAACIRLLPSQPQEPLQLSSAKEAMEKVDADFFSNAGQDWLVMVDRFSGYSFVQKFAHGTVAEKLVTVLQSWFFEYGLPKEIRSDNGPQFTSSTFKDFCNKFNIKHVTSSPHHHEANGVAEAGVKNIKYLMQKCQDQGESFPLALMEWKKLPSFEWI